VIGIIGKTAGQIALRYVLPGALVVLEVTQLVETERARREIKGMRSRVKKLEAKNKPRKSPAKKKKK
jgi:hypothetical protein